MGENDTCVVTCVVLLSLAHRQQDTTNTWVRDLCVVSNGHRKEFHCRDHDVHGRASGWNAVSQQMPARVDGCSTGDGRLLWPMCLT